MRFQMSARSLRICALALVSILTASCGTGDGDESVDASADSTTNAKLKLVFRDDFGGPAPALKGKGVAAISPKTPLPPGDWVVETGYGLDGWGNDEWQRYTSSMDNVFQENGNLVLRAQCTTAPACGKRDDTITSGKVITKDRLNVRYGRIRARIKMPSGLGMWPAFWTLGSDIDQRPWPDAGEIDIVEMHYFYSDIFTTHFTTHWSGPLYAPSTKPDCASGVGSSLDPNEEENCQTASKTFTTPLTDDYHIFELDWNENRIAGKIDGITYFQQAIDVATMEEFLKDHYLILNVAVGGTLGSPLGPSMSAADWADPEQTDMLVDWVEVWEKVPPSSATLIDESGKNLQYNKIINSVEFNGAFVGSKLKSTAVPALVGSSVLELKYSKSVSQNGGVTAGFSGAIFDFNQVNLSSFTTFNFSLDTSQFPNFEDIGIEFEDSLGNKVLVRTSNYPAAISGNWETYAIPLADFVPVDMNDIVAIGFFNPFNAGDQLIAGTLYVDNIVFTTEACTAIPDVEFDSIDYNPETVAARVTVNDLCAANSLVVVKIENAVDEIFVGVKLDAAGNGNADVNLVTEASICPTDDEFSVLRLAGTSIIATYKEDTASEATATAGIDPAAAITELPGDELYFFATDPNQALTYLPDNPGAFKRFNYSPFTSGSSFDGDFSDPDFDPVFEVTSGTGYGLQVAQIALINITPSGFATGIRSLNFKIKGLPDDKIRVDIGIAGGFTQGRIIDLLDTEFSNPIDNTNGWYDVSVPIVGDGWQLVDQFGQLGGPITQFSNLGLYNFFAIASAGTPPVSQFAYLITDIHLETEVGSLGPECAAPGIASTTPAEDPADVISLFSDTYTDVMVDTWSTVWDSTGVIDKSVQGSAVKRYGSLGFAGIETVVMPVDASGMTNFRIDAWSKDVTMLEVKLVDFGGDGFGGGNDTEASVNVPLSPGQWTKIDVDLSDLVADGLNADLNISQYILAAAEGSGSLYIDNVYFYEQKPSTAAPTPTVNPADVISVFSDAYNDIPGTDFNPNWGQATVVSFESIQGNSTLKYTGLNYQGIQLGSEQDLTTAGMDTLHLDFWTPNSTALNIYLISPGPAETAYALPITPGAWVSVDIPLESFSNVDLSNVIQMKFDGNGTIYIDNIYFYDVPTTSGVYSETNTDPTVPYVQIIDAGVSFGGNPTPSDENSVAVAPLDGSFVLAIDYQDTGKGYGGAIFNFGPAVVPPNPGSGEGQNVSAYTHLSFGIDTSAVASFADLVVQLEDGNVAPNVFLSNYTPVSTMGNWSIYEIPLADFAGLDPTNVTLLGFWNLSSTAGAVTITTGTIYLDDIHFTNTPTPPAAGGNLVTNGDFETGDFTGWVTIPNAGTITVVGPGSSSANAARLNAGVGSASTIKAEFVGAGTISASQNVTVSFDWKGNDADGGVIDARLFSEAAAGGVNDTDILLGGAAFPANWTNFSQTVTVGTDVGGGVTLEISAICGGAGACVSEVFIDNVSISAP